MSSAALEKVNQLILENVVMMFSKSYCPYCKRAATALTKNNIKFTQLELDQTDDGPALQAALLQKTGQRTVPNVFVHQKHIGGCDDLLAGLNNGSVQKLLASN
ncbi:Glutaredoxin [Dispira parvispora]|uniref:Glutaredoxin n=1 Tax=Dispira parvispora TaxID=1520584 RepID=A0A9W8AT32_9FUNG|nr:Glutaredoxin [Dispira parvispora]